MTGDFQLSSVWILCLVAGFLLQQITTVSAVYSMNQTCAQISEGFIANPNDCYSFGYCKNGVLQGVRPCPNGLMYYTRRAVCDTPSASGCTVSNTQHICQYAADRSFVADPDNCNRYFYCNNKVAESRNCIDGQIFDSKQTRCVWSSQANFKCTANSICRLLPDGTFAGDPDNCGQYISCVNDVGTPGKCPGNTYFNKNIGMCQNNNPCEKPTPAGIGPGVLTPLASNPGACKSLKGTFPAFVADGKTCMGYYICESNDGPGLWSKCPPGMHFNADKCVTPYTFACAFDRCGNLDQQFVGAIGSQCQNYLICKNETSQTEAGYYINYVGLPCSNHQYFNEFTQKCDDKAPASTNYKLCP